MNVLIQKSHGVEPFGISKQEKRCAVTVSDRRTLVFRRGGLDNLL